VVNQTLVFQIKFCGKSPALRVAAKRYSELTMNSRILATFIICLTILSCNGPSVNANQQSTGSIGNKNHQEPLEVSESDSLTMIISDVATSFHQWHFIALNKQNNTTPTGPYIVKGENGKCKLENKLYLAELRKLGTISEKFIQSENKRSSTCADYMSTVNWVDYKNSDAYEYSDYCPEFDYDYWTKSQEVFNGVIVDHVKKVNSTFWEVT
jgi:hypothetical protein